MQSESVLETPSGGEVLLLILCVSSLLLIFRLPGVNCIQSIADQRHAEPTRCLELAN